MKFFRPQSASPQIRNKKNSLNLETTQKDPLKS